MYLAVGLMSELLEKMENPWRIIGLFGQAVFTARFVVQWYASEKKKRTMVPIVFWYLSIAGTMLVLASAIATREPVFMMAYGFNVFIYVRNLMIAHRPAPLPQNTLSIK